MDVPNKVPLDHIITIIILLVLIVIYSYLLLSPTQPHVLAKPRNYVITPDTEANFAEFQKQISSSSNSGGGGARWYDDIFSYANVSGNSSEYWENEWKVGEKADDFFLSSLDPYEQSLEKDDVAVSNEPIVPSSRFKCSSGWITIRSELNYKYLWMHAGDNIWMGATATIETPLSRKAFQVIPIVSNCSDGWVLLREADLPGYIQMMAPTGQFAIDEWVVKPGTSDVSEALANPSYHFLLEEDGYLLNRGAMAFVNVMSEAEYSIRGHTGGWDRTKPAGREYTAAMKFASLDDAKVLEALEHEKQEEEEAEEEDKKLVAAIANFPKSTEKRVISFGLYGAKEKYTEGAVKNAQLAAKYFPGWVCRYYVTSDVPESIISRLKALNAEILPIPSNMGYSSGMFWRFMVADDPEVDRYIVRDVDSRLNARDRFAVEEWIRLKYPIHILRDHVNHCLVMNGGMWGGVKGGISHMKEEIDAWSNRDEYSADLHFLEQKIWPSIKDKQISHDSYCCDRFPNTRPYPTKRSATYQHVGQVFDSHDNPRLMDIDGFIRGVPIPVSCRKQSDWIYG